MRRTETLQVTETLSYHQLRDDGIVPDISLVSHGSSKSRFSPVLSRFIEKKSQREAFQDFYEQYFWSMDVPEGPDVERGRPLTVYNASKLDASWPELIPAWMKITEKYKGEKDITEEMWETLARSKKLKSWYDSHGVIFEDLAAREEYILLSQSLEVKVGSGTILRANPYALGAKTVYSIILVRDLCSANAEEAFLKLILDFTAYRLAGGSFSQIGLILPLQGKVVIRDLSDWKSESLLSLLRYSVMNPIQSVFRDLSLEKAEELTRIKKTLMGMTVPRGNGYETISKQCNSSRKPFQITLTVLQSDLSAENGYKDKKPIRKPDYLLIYKVLQKHKTRMYVLAPRQIELPKEKHWSHEILKKNLEISDEMGAQGVVVRVGKSQEGAGKKEAEERMYLTLVKILKSASEECPILLQTPAKEENELIANVEAFGDFYNRFSIDEKKRIKVCVDTGHVFSAGYQPNLYVERLEEMAPGSIGLVEFNGSKVGLGGCLDRCSWDWMQQAIYTLEIARDKAKGRTGTLGIPETTNRLPLHGLVKVAEWCEENKIDMVIGK